MAEKKETKSKKKLFISVPMKGRTEEAIKISMNRMHKIAEIIMDEEYDVIDSYVEHKSPKNANEAVWYLGSSLQKLSEADIMVGLAEIDNFAGCQIERAVAYLYGIPYIRTFAEQVAVDLLQVEQPEEEFGDFDIAEL